jgi:hypothetical protein
MKHIKLFESFLNEIVSKNHNWIRGVTQSSEVRSKIEDLAKKVNDIFSKKGVSARIELFDSGYCGFVVNWDNEKLYMFDQPGKVGLEDQSMPYISLTHGLESFKDKDKAIVTHAPDYFSRNFGQVKMDAKMRDQAYSEILDWFEKNVKAE